METIEELISKNKNLIYDIVNNYPSYKSKEDLFQAGCMGMIEAYNNFDENRKCKFTTYAYPYIFGEINKFVKEDHNIKLNREMSKIKSKIEKARNYLTQYLMEIPTTKQLSDYLEIDENIVSQILNYSDTFSIDEIIGDDLSLHEVIPTKEVDYNTLLALKEEIERLEEPERTIMYKRYYEDLTQTEIASLVGISQVDVSRREKKVLTKLRKNLWLTTIIYYFIIKIGDDMKKGFTLMELLAVFIVIGIIMTITTPIITNVIRDSKEKTYKEQVSLIEEAARNYMASHSTELPKASGKASVSVSTLQSEGLLSNKDIINPIYNINGTRDEEKHQTFTGSVCVTYVNNKYKYTYKQSGSC